MSLDPQYILVSFSLAKSKSHLPLHQTISGPQTRPGCWQTSAFSSQLLRFRLFGENDCNTWAFPLYFSLSSKCSFMEEQVSVSKWLLYAWQVEIAAPVTLMVSEVTLRLWRLLGRTASRKLMSIPAWPWAIKRGGCCEERRREIN